MRLPKLFSVFAVAAVLSVPAYGRGNFFAELTPEERQAAGISRLSPEEIEVLNKAAERYRMSGKEERNPAGATAAEEREPGWLRALITLRKTGEKPDSADPYVSRYAGDISNFSGKRRFELENGHVWQMVESGSYAGPVLEKPRVTIRPASMGTYWLKIEGSGRQFRVRPEKLD